MREDRRADPRIEIVLKVDYQSPRGLLSDYLGDLSAGGLFIHTDVAFEVGQRIAFTISFPGLVDPIELAGLVRWRRTESTQTRPAGVGVEFVFENKHQRRNVEWLLACVRADAEIPASESPFRVLLLDDNRFVPELFSRALRRFRKDRKMANFELYATTEPQEALRIIEETGSDLAIVDHYLPTMSGVEVVRKLRADPRFGTLPILVVSVGGTEIRREALEAGADGFLTKPVLLKQLVTTLHKLVPFRHDGY